MKKKAIFLLVYFLLAHKALAVGDDLLIKVDDVGQLIIKKKDE